MTTATTPPTINERTRTWLAGGPLGHVIGGRTRVPGGAPAPVINPADGATLCQVAMGGNAEITAATTTAHDAFPAWAATPVAERAALLHRLADAMEADAAVLAELETLDVGKAIATSEGFDVPFGIACIRYFADLILKTPADTPLDLDQIDARVHRAPWGVCGFVFPWNFPLDLLIWGIAPALAAGNTVVVKPSEETPLTTLYVAELALSAGLPAGVFNVVVGAGSDTGPALIDDPHVRRMSFTGSPAVGRLIGEACGRRLIPCKLELGGKGAAVVFDDVDIAHVAAQLAGALTLNTGQVCCTATRWIVQESIVDAFEKAVIEALQKVAVGPGLDRSTEMGPLASARHRDRVLGYIDRGIAEGAAAPLPGGPVAVADHPEGFYVSPTLLRGTPDNVCFREEVFGPVAYVTTFKDEADAVAQTNALDYGLANSVWTADLPRAHRVAEQLVAGNNWINAHNVFAYGLPYGGVNLSGGGGGVNSPDTLRDYLRPTTIARPL